MATAQQPILDSLYNKLTSDSTVNTAVSGRIYGDIAQQDPVLPFILVSLVSDVPVGGFTFDSIQPDVQVDIYGNMNTGPKGTRIIADAVYAALHGTAGKTLTITGYTGCSIRCRDRGGQPQDEFVVGGKTQQDALRIMQTYRIWGTGT